MEVFVNFACGCVHRDASGLASMLQAVFMGDSVAGAGAGAGASAGSSGAAAVADSADNEFGPSCTAEMNERIADMRLMFKLFFGAPSSQIEPIADGLTLMAQTFQTFIEHTGSKVVDTIRQQRAPGPDGGVVRCGLGFFPSSPWLC